MEKTKVQNNARIYKENSSRSGAVAQSRSFAYTLESIE